MSEVRARLNEPMVFIQTTRVGQGVLHDRQLEQRLAHDAATGIFQYLDRVDHQHWAETRSTLEVTALGIGYSRLQLMLGESTARELLVAMEITRLPSAQAHPVPGHLKAILESCLTDHLSADLRRLHAQARVLDFLVALVGHWHGPVRPEAHKRNLVDRVREELDQLNGQIPDLDELARRIRSLRIEHLFAPLDPSRPQQPAVQGIALPTGAYAGLERLVHRYAPAL
jgi:hypothetical protein